MGRGRGDGDAGTRGRVFGDVGRRDASNGQIGDAWGREIGDMTTGGNSGKKVTINRSQKLISSKD